MKQNVKCLNPHCQKEAATRGLCIGCYNVARRLVKKGIVTWETLQKHGRVRKPGDTSNATQAWLLGND